MHLHVGRVDAGSAVEKELGAEHHGELARSEPEVVPAVGRG